MINRVKYAPVRKYRDVGFNEPPEKEERTRPKTSVSLKEKEERIRTRRPILLRKNESFFQKIKRVIKNILKK
jgi:hypothetical protein